jgi:ankyrin repeat protein
VKYLVKNGAKIESKDNNGFTSLHFASTEGHLDIVKYLVDNGADIESKDKDESFSVNRATIKRHFNDIYWRIQRRKNKYISLLRDLIFDVSLINIDIY